RTSASAYLPLNGVSACRCQRAASYHSRLRRVQRSFSRSPLRAGVLSMTRGVAQICRTRDIVSRLPLLTGLVLLLTLPSVAFAAGEGPLDLPGWTAVPFVVLLLCIAFLPLAAGNWWHSNRNKLIVSAAVAVPVAAYLAFLHLTTAQKALVPLAHEVFKYFS